MERLKQLRNEKGLTQQEVSDAVGVARETYARYESGARTPDIDMLSRLADLFGVSTDYLLGRTDIPNVYVHDGIKLPDGREGALQNRRLTAGGRHTAGS